MSWHEDHVQPVSDERPELEDGHELGHEHWVVEPPEGTVAYCPVCQDTVLEVQICTDNPECLMLPCEHPVHMTEFEKMVDKAAGRT